MSRCDPSLGLTDRGGASDVLHLAFGDFMRLTVPAHPVIRVILGGAD